MARVKCFPGFLGPRLNIRGIPEFMVCRILMFRWCSGLFRTKALEIRVLKRLKFRLQTQTPTKKPLGS